MAISRSLPHFDRALLLLLEADERRVIVVILSASRRDSLAWPDDCRAPCVLRVMAACMGQQWMVRFSAPPDRSPAMIRISATVHAVGFPGLTPMKVFMYLGRAPSQRMPSCRTHRLRVDDRAEARGAPAVSADAKVAWMRLYRLSSIDCSLFAASMARARCPRRDRPSRAGQLPASRLPTRHVVRDAGAVRPWPRPNSPLYEGSLILRGHATSPGTVRA